MQLAKNVLYLPDSARPMTPGQVISLSSREQKRRIEANFRLFLETGIYRSNVLRLPWNLDVGPSVIFTNSLTTDVCPHW